MTTLREKHRLRRRHGLSLLEVMLALAILGGAIAVIGELMRFGMKNAESARDLSIAQVFCEAKINEIAAGLLPLQSMGSTPIEEIAALNSDAPWLYAVEVQEIDQQGLVAVRVTVSQDPDVKFRPVSFSLVRWMIDPAQQEMTDTGSTGSSTGGTSG